MNQLTKILRVLADIALFILAYLLMTGIGLFILHGPWKQPVFEFTMVLAVIGGGVFALLVCGPRVRWIRAFASPFALFTQLFGRFIISKYESIVSVI